jgi:hypothetical protein
MIARGRNHRNLTFDVDVTSLAKPPDLSIPEVTLRAVGAAHLATDLGGLSSLET